MTQDVCANFHKKGYGILPECVLLITKFRQLQTPTWALATALAMGSDPLVTNILDPPLVHVSWHPRNKQMSKV